MNWSDRIDSYNRFSGFPNSLFIAGDGRAVGVWILGNDYRVKSEYHGGYPNTYLRRVKTLFPDKARVLHLFSGRVDCGIIAGDTVDINPTLAPTYLDDAQTLAAVPLEAYDLVLADPPYSQEDADCYGTTMVKRNAVMRALQRCRPGAHIGWLDMTLPMYRKDFFTLEACIAIQRSTNHRVRMLWVWRRTGLMQGSLEALGDGADVAAVHAG